MKTRRQKAEQEQAGIPPTPPRELPTTTRTKRAQNTRSNADTELPTYPQRSTRRAASTRTTRGSKRGRPAKQPPADAADISDVSTQGDTATHSDTSANITAEPVVENQERETPTSPKTPVAHPVPGSEAQVSKTPPTTSPSATRPPSATSVMFAEALASVAPRLDLHPTFPFKERPVLQALSPKARTSPKSRSPDPNASGQTSPITSPLPGSSPKLDLPDHIALQQTSPTVSPLPGLSPKLNISDHVALQQSHTLSSSSSVATPSSQKPPFTPSLPLDPSQFVFNWPKPSETEKLHAIIHVLVDARVAERLGKAGQDPKLAVAIPSDMLPDLLAFIAKHPSAQESELRNLLQVHPVANDVTNELTEIASADSITPKKRKLRDDAEHDTIVDTGSEAKGNRLRKAFAETSARKIRNALEEIDHQPTAQNPSDTPERAAKRTKRVPQMYDDRGMLTLGAFKEVPIDSDDDEADSQGQRRVEHEPETPRARGWGLASFLPSARSVARFIPGLSHNTPFADPPPPATPAQQTPNTTAVLTSTNNINFPVTPEPNNQHPVSAQTEPRPNFGAEGSWVNPVIENATARPALRHPVSQPKRQLLTRGEAEQNRKYKEERKKIQEQIEILRKEEARMAEEMRRREEAEHHRIETEKTQQPGTKRKRLPSPDVIPNPPGVSYGMDLQYFGFDSDEEEDDEESTTPTRERPSKRTRLSLPGGGDAGGTFSAPLYTGNPFKATPYTGTMFAIPSKTKDNSDGNPFGEQTSSDEIAVQSNFPKNQTYSPTTPVPGPTMTFKVPSPTDSDEEEDEYEDDVSAIITPTKSVSTSSTTANTPTIIQTSPLKSKVTQTNQIMESPQVIKPTAPPARPTPQHASLPSTGLSTSAASDTALARARHHALKHQPVQPSRLRESSRLSTSTVGLEAEEEGPNDNEQLGPEVESKHITQTSPAPPHAPAPLPPRQQPSATEVASSAATITSIFAKEEGHTDNEQLRPEVESRQITQTSPAPSHAPAPSPPRQQPSATKIASSAVTATPMYASYVNYHEMMTGRVKKLIDKDWDDIVDSNAASTQFDKDFAAWRQQLSEAGSPKSEVEIAPSSSVPAASGAASNNSAQAFTSQSTAVSARVQAFIESNWKDGDEDISEMDFTTQLEAWKAANNGGSTIFASAV